jgi:hypothetical protein
LQYKKTDINPAKISKTETDSGLAVVLYVANLVESDAKDLSKNNFGNLLNKKSGVMTVVQVCNSFRLKLQSSCLFIGEVLISSYV